MRAPRLLFALAGLAILWSEGRADTPDLRGRWVGTLHTLQGSCPDARNSTLVIDNKHLSFAPADGVLVLHGTQHPGDPGHLHAQLKLAGINHKPVPMVFEAHPEGDAIVGLYGTPNCRASIRLERPVDHPLQRVLGR